jgi:hypothetical protein
MLWRIIFINKKRMEAAGVEPVGFVCFYNNINLLNITIQPATNI